MTPPTNIQCGHEQLVDGHRQQCARERGHTGLCGPYVCLGCVAGEVGNLADKLPEHIGDYVQRIRPRMMGGQRVVEFKPGGVAAIDELDLVDIAGLLLAHPVPGRAGGGHCWTCGSRDCEPGCCPGPSPDDDLMLATDEERNSGSVR